MRTGQVTRAPQRSSIGSKDLRAYTRVAGQLQLHFSRRATLVQLNLGQSFAELFLQTRGSGGLLQGAFDEFEAALGFFAQRLAAVVTALAQGIQFVGNGQRGQHGHAHRIHRPGGAGDLAHLVVHVLRQLGDVRGVKIAGDIVVLIVDLDFHA